MNGNELSLREILTTLQQRLERLSLPELRQALLTHAAGIPADERRIFLNIFLSEERVPEGQHASVQIPPVVKDLTWPVDSDPRLADIDDFAGRVASGHFFEGFGWDHEIHDERSFGDESWADEMADYFNAAQEAFSTGHLGLARAAFRKLFDTLGLDDEVGTFSGPEPATEMLDASLHEAMSQYLRAVYETSHPDKRAGELARQWSRLPLPGEEPSLQDIRDCAPEDVPEIDGFLPLWVRALSAEDRGQKLILTLLVEAAKMSQGLVTLGELARQPGPGQGSLFLEWIQALRSAGDTAQAADAAREALSAPEVGSYNQAAIAEELAELSAPDAAAVLEARRLAWRSSPNATRLLVLHHAAAQLGHPAQVMAEELQHAESFKHLSGALGRSLFSCLLLRSGELERATRLLSLPPAQRENEVSGSILIPYLLVSASKALVGTPDAKSWAHSYLNTVNSNAVLHRQHGGSKVEGIPTLSELFEARICAEATERTGLVSRLEAAHSQLGRDVDAIVSDKRRGEYAKAAEWLAHGARALSLARGDAAGASWFRDWSTRYPRHVALRRELERTLPGATSTR